MLIKFNVLENYLLKKNLFLKETNQFKISKFLVTLSTILQKSEPIITSKLKKHLKLPLIFSIFFKTYNFRLDTFSFINFGRGFLNTKEKKLKKEIKQEERDSLKKKVIRFCKKKKIVKNSLVKNIILKFERKQLKKKKKERRRRIFFLRRKKKARRTWSKKKFRVEKYDITPLLNLLKSKSKFQKVKKSFFRNSRVYFKYTGSNIFVTITNSLGEVKYIYSGGSFISLRTRKEKTTIFLAQNLGELVASRLEKTNAREIFFFPCLNHTKARLLLRYFRKGFKLIRNFNFSKVFLKRKVMRNGVRLRKVARK